MGIKRILFHEGEPYMAATTTYPETYSPDRPAWCWEESAGVWAIRVVGENADHAWDFCTEPSERRARTVVDQLNGMTTELDRVIAAIDRDYERCKAAANAQAKQGVLL